MKERLLKYYQTLKKSQNRWLRIVLGVLLIICGLVGFLPVLGFWMVPLGLALLAIDFPVVRRFNQRMLALGKRLRERFRTWRADRPGRSGSGR